MQTPILGKGRAYGVGDGTVRKSDGEFLSINAINLYFGHWAYIWEIVGISKSTLDPLRSNQCNYWLGVVHLTCGNK